MAALDEAAIATEIAHAVERGRQISTFTSRSPAFDVDAAWRVLARLHAMRIRAGFRPVGRKIGFTNTTIWERYGVDRPMWSHVWDRTLSDWPGGEARISISALCEPRIEPEVVFGLRAPLPAGRDAPAILEAVEWIAPGFEIVQSIFPGWQFRIADCTAAFALHGALAVGPRRTLDASDRERLALALPAMEVALHRDGNLVDRGVGANVLGSPALALAYLRDILAERPEFPPLAAGEIVTTGTITDAQSLRVGEHWSAEFGDPLLGHFALTVVP